MGLIWKPMEEMPDEGTFLVYMPEEFDPYQVMVRHPNVTVIGHTFDFVLTKPTMFAEILTADDSPLKPE